MSISINCTFIIRLYKVQFSFINIENTNNNSFGFIYLFLLLFFCIFCFVCLSYLNKNKCIQRYLLLSLSIFG